LKKLVLYGILYSVKLQIDNLEHESTDKGKTAVMP